MPALLFRTPHSPTPLAINKRRLQRPRGSSMSSVSDLPFEILALIFEAFCAASGSNHHDVRYPELRLTHVCRYWREAANNMPILWTSFGMSSGSSRHIISLYLKRSQHLPLSLQCNLCCGFNDRKKRGHALELWKLIKTASLRWQQLWVRFDQRDAPAITAELQSVAVPLLEDLQLSSTSQTDNTVAIFQEGLPSLKKLCLGGISLNQFHSINPGVTHLDLTSCLPMPFDEFQGMMSQLPNLEELNMRGSVANDWPLQPSPNDIIEMPSLRVLRLSESQTLLFIPLLSISAPALHTLAIFDLVATDLPDRYLEPWVCKNFPAIRHLVLEGNSYIDTPSFASLHRIFPTADHLAFIGTGDTFAQEVSHILHNTTLWPKLRALTMVPSPSESHLCSLINARTDSVTSLETVVIPSGTRLKRKIWINQKVRLGNYKVSKASIQPVQRTYIPPYSSSHMVCT